MTITARANTGQPPAQAGASAGAVSPLAAGSIGLQLLRVAIDGGSRQSLRQLDLSLFSDDERPAIEFAVNHVDVHGAMPSVQIMRENGFLLGPTSGGNFSYYLERLRDRAVHKAASDGAAGLVSALKARNTEQVRQIVETMAGQMQAVSAVQGTISLTSAMAQVWAEYQVARSSPGMRGISTGFSPLDSVTAGLRNGDVTTLVARPGVGKSWSIMKMALSAWLAGASIVFVSMEMTAIETARRLIGMAVGTNPDLISRGQVSFWGEEVLQEWIATVPGRPPFNMVIGDLSKSIRDVDHAFIEFSPDIGYIDASYLLKSTKDNMFRGKRWESIAEVAEGVKGLALKHDKHIVQTVQFNRTSTEEEEMDLGQIGGTDVIGQVSSLAVGIRIGAAPNERTQRRYKVLKNRHGIDWLSFETNFLFSPFDMTVLGSNLPENLADEDEGDAVGQPAGGGAGYPMENT